MSSKKHAGTRQGLKIAQAYHADVLKILVELADDVITLRRIAADCKVPGFKIRGVPKSAKAELMERGFSHKSIASVKRGLKDAKAGKIKVGRIPD